MTLQGVDALYPPSGAALQAAGKSFACIYTKTATPSMIADLISHRVAPVLWFETTGTDFTGGASQGAADARLAQSQLGPLGYPSAVTYFAIDEDTTDYGGVCAYLDGVASVLGLPRTGLYGSADVCSGARGHATYYAQTYAWSGGVVLPWVHLLQYLNGQSLGGATVDFDRTIVSDTDFGQIGAPGPPSGEVSMFWVKDPSSALCITFDGAYGLGIPDETTLNAIKAAGVSELPVSQAYFDSIPMAAAIPQPQPQPSTPDIPGGMTGVPQDLLVFAGAGAVVLGKGGQVATVYSPSWETAPVTGTLTIRQGGKEVSSTSVSLQPGGAPQDITLPASGEFLVEFLNTSTPPQGEFARAYFSVHP